MAKLICTGLHKRGLLGGSVMGALVGLLYLGYYMVYNFVTYAYPISDYAFLLSPVILFGGIIGLVFGCLGNSSAIAANRIVPKSIRGEIRILFCAFLAAIITGMLTHIVVSICLPSSPAVIYDLPVIVVSFFWYARGLRRQQQGEVARGPAQ